MKKYAFFAAAVAALMTCACSVEPIDVTDAQPEEDGEITVLTAGFAGAEDGTRTVRQSDGKVFWSPKDEISVVRGTNRTGKKFVSTNTEPAPQAAFTGTMPSGTAAFWALHPYDAQAVFDGTYFITTLPAEQTAVPDTFDEDLFISVANSKNESVTFYHVVGGFKFSVTEPGIQKVTLASIGGEPLAGVMGIQVVNGRPTFVAWGDSSSQIELTPESGTFEVGKAYYFVTLPMELESGFSLFFEKEDGSTAYRLVKKPVSIEAAHFKTMMEVDKGIVFEKNYFTYSPNSISLSKYGGTFSIKVHSSVDFHFDIVSDWIQEVAHEGDPKMESTYTFKAFSNPGEAREGYIMLCNDSNCFFITVNQDAGSEDDWKSAEFVHHSLGMRFTATWCGYCPNMSETFRLAKGKLLDKFQYACFYSSSSGGLYGFSDINILANQYAIEGFPNGIVDGRRLIQNYSASYACSLIVQASQETEANYPTATALGINSILSGKNLSVDVDVYTHIADSYKLTVLLLENGIVGYQQDFYVGAHDDFVHDKVVRAAFTNVSGNAFTAESAQTKKSFSYTFTVPDEYKADNLEILAYVQRPFGSQPVLQSGSYGDWYVDNCSSAKVGLAAPPDLK